MDYILRKMLGLFYVKIHIPYILAQCAQIDSHISRPPHWTSKTFKI